MADQDGNPPVDSSHSNILQKIKRLVAESRLNPSSSDQLSMAPLQIQDTGVNQSSSSHQSQTPSVSRDNSFYDQIPLKTVSQHTGEYQGLFASRRNGNSTIHGGNSPHSQLSNFQSFESNPSSPSYNRQSSMPRHFGATRNQRPSVFQAFDNIGDQNSAPNQSQTPRAPRGDSSDNHLSSRPRKDQNNGGHHNPTPQRNPNSGASRQTLRSQNWSNRRDQGTTNRQHPNSNAGTHNNPDGKRGKNSNPHWDGKSSMRQKNFHPEQHSTDQRSTTWNARRDLNPKPWQNQHPASKAQGKKFSKLHNHDDWRHEDAINDEDLVKWYE
ncbi:hypothetical protein V8F20_009362 [Naviculisporaceae sp. PSN 640]